MINKVYDEFDKMISDLAWKYARQTGIEMHELKNEAYLYIAKKIDRFDQSKSCLSTYIHRLATSAMKNYIGRQFRHDEEMPEDYNPPQKENWFSHFLSELTEETQTLAKATIEASEELADSLTFRNTRKAKKREWFWIKNRESYQTIKNHIIHNYGWDDSTFNKSAKELYAALS